MLSSHRAFQLERHTLTIEDKGPAGLHHWNAAGVSFRTYVSVCVAEAGVRAVPPLRKPFEERQDYRNQPFPLFLTESITRRSFCIILTFHMTYK